MSRKSLAAFGLAAAATTGISFAATDIASASLVPGVKTAHLAAVAPPTVHPVVAELRAHLVSVRTAAPVPAPPAPAPVRPTTYTVVQGDCLWTIGQRFGVSMYAMADANGMQLSDILYVGRVLILPPAGTQVAAPAPPPVTHTFSAPRTYTHSSPRTYTYTAPTHHSVSHASTGGGAVAGSGLEQCIISRESGGNASAYNPNGHWGLYQFSRSTWEAYGGSAASYGSASAGAQQQVFHNAIAAGGASNWTPYDGC